MAKKHGKKGKLKINGADFHVTDWELDDSDDTPDATTTASNGRMERLSGISDAKGSFKTLWDDAVSLAAITKGATIDITMYVGDPVDNKFYRRNGIISSVKVNSGVKALVQLAVDWLLKDGTLDADPA